MLKGETISSGAPSVCPECSRVLEFKVCSSFAGYYIGTECDCGPYSRETGYYRTYAEAVKVLDSCR